MTRNCCIIEPDEPCELWRARIVRARVSHVCCECGETVKPGSLYEVVAAKDYGDPRFRHHKTCARCVNIRDEYFPMGYYVGNIVEDFRECFGFDYRDGIPADFAPCKEARDE